MAMTRNKKIAIGVSSVVGIVILYLILKPKKAATQVTNTAAPTGGTAGGGLAPSQPIGVGVVNLGTGSGGAAIHF